RANLRERLLTMVQTGGEVTTNYLTKHIRFREAAFDASPVAQIVIDVNGYLVLCNERARSLLNVTAKDIGRQYNDLDFSYRIPDLRTRIEESYAERRPIALKEIDWATPS